MHHQDYRLEEYSVGQVSNFSSLDSFPSRAHEGQCHCCSFSLSANKGGHGRPLPTDLSRQGSDTSLCPLKPGAHILDCPRNSLVLSSICRAGQASPAEFLHYNKHSAKKKYISVSPSGNYFPTF